jgi:hypothetical protein
MAVTAAVVIAAVVIAAVVIRNYLLEAIMEVRSGLERERGKKERKKEIVAVTLAGLVATALDPQAQDMIVLRSSRIRRRKTFKKNVKQNFEQRGRPGKLLPTFRVTDRLMVPREHGNRYHLPCPICRWDPSPEHQSGSYFKKRSNLM